MKNAQRGCWSTARIVQYQSITVAIAWWRVGCLPDESVLELGERWYGEEGEFGGREEIFSCVG